MVKYYLKRLTKFRNVDDVSFTNDIRIMAIDPTEKYVIFNNGTDFLTVLELERKKPVFSDGLTYLEGVGNIYPFWWNDDPQILVSSLEDTDLYLYSLKRGTLLSSTSSLPFPHIENLIFLPPPNSNGKDDDLTRKQPEIHAFSIDGLEYCHISYPHLTVHDYWKLPHGQTIQQFLLARNANDIEAVVLNQRKNAVMIVNPKTREEIAHIQLPPPLHGRLNNVLALMHPERNRLVIIRINYDIETESEFWLIELKYPSNQKHDTPEIEKEEDSSADHPYSVEIVRVERHFIPLHYFPEVREWIDSHHLLLADTVEWLEGLILHIHDQPSSNGNQHQKIHVEYLTDNDFFSSIQHIFCPWSPTHQHPPSSKTPPYFFILPDAYAEGYARTELSQLFINLRRSRSSFAIYKYLLDPKCCIPQDNSLPTHNMRTITKVTPHVKLALQQARWHATLNPTGTVLASTSLGSLDFHDVSEDNGNNGSLHWLFSKTLTSRGSRILAHRIQWFDDHHILVLVDGVLYLHELPNDEKHEKNGEMSKTKNLTKKKNRITSQVLLGKPLDDNKFAPLDLEREYVIDFSLSPQKKFIAVVMDDGRTRPTFNIHPIRISSDTDSITLDPIYRSCYFSYPTSAEYSLKLFWSNPKAAYVIPTPNSLIQINLEYKTPRPTTIEIPKPLQRKLTYGTRIVHRASLTLKDSSGESNGNKTSRHDLFIAAPEAKTLVLCRINPQTRQLELLDEHDPGERIVSIHALRGKSILLAGTTNGKIIMYGFRSGKFKRLASNKHEPYHLPVTQLTESNSRVVAVLNDTTFMLHQIMKTT